MLESILLVSLLCVDSFVVSFGYGTNNIKLPIKSINIITLVSSLVLGISLFLGSIISRILTPSITLAICFSILFLIGSLRLFESILKSYLRRKSINSRNYTFNIFDVKFNIDMSVAKECLDRNKTKIVGVKEAFSIALACSLDGMAIGFGAALVGINYIEVIILSFIFNTIVLILGSFIGRKINEKISLNLSWISGLLLIIIAFMKL
ncbi:manganese efflux pump [Clostridium cylindrosporum]|uniref:Putative membrane protein n=1 Tax=Clostridium cylindrosporum DSM 605 TaxID=1121307 RepID=A0A0J8DAX2_CLOCY|nr:manganese efflux pump [Clostridium cylindrosporum]KMT23200.1 putative membrane protein [Clostridium cylindrosporum DSM 605]